MKTFLRPLGIFLACGLFILFRAWQAQQAFKEQQGIFPNTQQGVFQAWVSEEPEVLFEHQPGSHATGRSNGSYQPFVREVRAICTLISFNGDKTSSVKARCTFRLSSEVQQPVLSYGDVLGIAGKIQRPPPAMNPGQFDYVHYLRNKGVAYVMYVASGKWKKTEQPEIATSQTKPIGAAPRNDRNKKYGWTFLRWSYALKRTAEEAVYSFLPYPENSLLDGLLLGERGALPSDMVESFMATGTVHILAVSGLITAFVAGLFFLVFRVLQFKRKWAAGLSLLGLAFFVFMTGAHPPVCRAGLFSGLALLAILFERKIRGGTLLLATAIILLLLNPFLLEDLSFQISFLATAGLMVFAGRLMEKLSFLWKPAALLLTATLAAQVSVWCLLIFYFNQPAFYSPLANLLIVPLALFVTAGGLTALIGNFLCPFLGQLFGTACEVPLKLLIWLAGRMSDWPGARLIVSSPPVEWAIAFHALFLLFLVWYWPRPRPEAPSEQWKAWDNIYLKGKKAVAWAVILFFAGSVTAWGYRVLQPQPLRAIFLSVGHGNAVVLRSPQGRVLVVDGGKETRGPDRYQPLVAYLRHIGVQKVEGVLNTHPDEDHVGGLVNVLSAYPTAHAYEGEGARADTRIYRQFKEEIRDFKVSYFHLAEGSQVRDLEPAQVTVLHPPSHYAPRLHADNNLSVVSQVSFAGFNLILPGDLEKEGLLKLLKDNQPFPKVDWLMAPHHGRPSGEPGLCAQGFKPRFVVFSDWKDYPNDHIFFQSAVPGAVVLATATEGAIEVEMNPDGIGRYRTFREGQWHPFRAGD